MTTGFISKSNSKKLRLILSGLPNSGKTTSLATFDPPHVIVVSPGEKGIASLPEGEGITTAIYHIDPDDKRTSGKIIEEFESALLGIAYGAGASTPYTLTLEGNHKLYEYYLDIVTDGDYFSGKEFDPRLFGQAHRMYSDLLNKLFHSSVPVVVYTSWAELEYKEDQLSAQERKYKRRYYYPNLPGKMSKQIMGEVDGAIYADIRSQCNMSQCKDKAEGKEHYLWQLNPSGDVRGVGFKLPYGAKSLPTFIHGRDEHGRATQDWQLLKKLLHERGVQC